VGRTSRSILVGPTAGFGAFRLLPSVPAKVGLLNPKPALDLGDGGCSLCPEADTHDHPHERRGRVMGWTPPDGICVPR